MDGRKKGNHHGWPDGQIGDNGNWHGRMDRWMGEKWESAWMGFFLGGDFKD